MKSHFSVGDLPWEVDTLPQNSLVNSPFTVKKSHNEILYYNKTQTNVYYFYTGMRTLIYLPISYLCIPRENILARNLKPILILCSANSSRMDWFESGREGTLELDCILHWYSKYYNLFVGYLQFNILVPNY